MTLGLSFNSETPYSCIKILISVYKKSLILAIHSPLFRYGGEWVILKERWGIVDKYGDNLASLWITPSFA